MANAVLVLLYETMPAIPMQCAEGTSIAKGTALKLSAGFTVIAVSAADDEFGGVAAEEKIGGDGKKTIAVYRDGYFKAEAGTTGVSLGMPVKIEALNEFTTTAANNSDIGYNWGTALEAATDGQFFVLDLGRGN